MPGELPVRQEAAQQDTCKQASGTAGTSLLACKTQAEVPDGHQDRGRLRAGPPDGNCCIAASWPESACACKCKQGLAPAGAGSPSSRTCKSCTHWLRLGWLSSTASTVEQPPGPVPRGACAGPPAGVAVVVGSVVFVEPAGAAVPGTAGGACGCSSAGGQSRLATWLLILMRFPLRKLPRLLHFRLDCLKPGRPRPAASCLSCTVSCPRAQVADDQKSHKGPELGLPVLKGPYLQRHRCWYTRCGGSGRKLRWLGRQRLHSQRWAGDERC